jgi:hypothetical protein
MVSLIVIRYLIGEWVPFCWVALGLFVFFMGQRVARIRLGRASMEGFGTRHH